MQSTQPTAGGSEARRKLIGYAVAHLRGQQIGAMWVENERNVAARRFYEKLGFRGLEGAPDVIRMMALDFGKE